MLFMHIHVLSSEIINCYLHGLFYRNITSHANAKALVPQNERRIPIEDVLGRVLEEHVAVNVRVDPRRSLAKTRWVTLLVCSHESWTTLFCLIIKQITPGKFLAGWSAALYKCFCTVHPLSWDALVLPTNMYGMWPQIQIFGCCTKSKLMQHFNSPCPPEIY